MRQVILGEVDKFISNRESSDPVTVRCIGHSLGGALAMINAADLSQFRKVKITLSRNFFSINLSSIQNYVRKISKISLEYPYFHSLEV